MMSVHFQQDQPTSRLVGREVGIAAERRASRERCVAARGQFFTLRASFTLVELLIVIGIITVLASLTLASLFSVQEDAKERRTMAQVAKLNDIVMGRWEAYQSMTMRLDITAIPRVVDPPNLTPIDVAKARLNAMRELQRMELPDRISDVLYPPVTLVQTPSVWRGYRRRVAASAAVNFNVDVGGDSEWGFQGVDDDNDGLVDNASEVGWIRVSAAGVVTPSDDNISGWTVKNESAECLYMIIASARDGDKNGLDFFRPAELGDTDGDGMPEILDPWGIPINFLRWAPGFTSPLQDPGDRHEELFDPLKIDPRYANNVSGDPDSFLDDPWQLFPLIFAAGRDHESGIILTDSSGTINYALTNLAPYTNTVSPNPFGSPPWPPLPWVPSGPARPLWTARPPNDPYVIPPVSGIYIGTRFSGVTTHVDNIHNHLLKVR